MNHTQILKRAWNILWSYKTLWVFGILLAITAGGGGGNGGGSNFNSSRDDFSIQRHQFSPQVQELVRDLERLFSQEMMGFWIGLGIALVCLALLVGVLFTIVKYVSQTSLIRMVDGYEASGEKVGWRQGWRLGWTRSAWRLFLIDLVIGLPIAVVAIGLFGCAMLPVITSLASGREEPAFGWILTTIGMVFVVLFFIFVISLALGLVIHLIRRACVLGGNGVIDSIRSGVKLFTGNFKDVFLMWLILAGVHIAYAIVTIPVALLLVGIGLLVGGGAGAATYFGLQAIASQWTAIISAAILGLGLFFIILGIPLTFLEGLRQTYFSSAWTLAYRHLTLARPATPVEVLDAAEALPPPAGIEPSAGELPAA